VKKQNTTLTSTGFNYSASNNAKVLILGSMPSIVSLEQQQYYANPRNCFWDIIEALFSIPRCLDYEQRLLQLQSQNIALWDVVFQCVRKGSLDSNITQVKPNDFSKFYCDHSAVRHVFFNGKKAADLYKKKVAPKLSNNVQQLTTTTLPSTSPAHATVTIQQKLKQWRVIQLATEN